MTGHIRSIVEDKGYGFISSDGNDYFFHHSGCNTPYEELRKGDAVEFETEKSPKGLRAKDVTLVAEKK